jgi:hypothetical protein
MRQRGEGKIGCLFSMLIFGALAAAAYRGVPIYYGSSELVDACDLIASSAAHKPVEIIEREVKDKAKELGVTEALSTKDAIHVSKTGSGEVTTCTIKLHYTRLIDFYGVYQFPLEVDKRISKPIFETM